MRGRHVPARRAVHPAADVDGGRATLRLSIEGRAAQRGDLLQRPLHRTLVHRIACRGVARADAGPGRGTRSALSLHGGRLVPDHAGRHGAAAPERRRHHRLSPRRRAHHGFVHGRAAAATGRPGDPARAPQGAALRRRRRSDALHLRLHGVRPAPVPAYPGGAATRGDGEPARRGPGALAGSLAAARRGRGRLARARGRRRAGQAVRGDGGGSAAPVRGAALARRTPAGSRACATGPSASAWP